jgi:nitroreductase
MDVQDAIRTLRAVRRYEERSLPAEVVTRILDAGRRTQSSMNQQPWQFVATHDRALLRELATCGKYAGHVADAALTVSLLRIADDVDFDLGQAAAFMQLAALAEGVGSCLIAWWEPDRVRGILGLPPEATSEYAVAFGYAAEPPRPRAKGRRSLDEIVHVDRWGGR